MTVDRIGAAISILGGMVLVGSALIARRTQLRAGGWRMAAPWAVLFVLLFLASRWIDSHR